MERNKKENIKGNITSQVEITKSITKRCIKEDKKMKILITGSAGFIGSNLVERLLSSEKDIEIIGLDSVNDYYDVALKEYRLNRLDEIAKQFPVNKWIFVKGNLADKALIDKLFAENDFEIVVNLAAQAGVRYSIENPDA